MSEWIIIPTYNERENASKLIPEVFQHVPGAQLLIVDDDSPDGTSREVEEMKPAYPGRLHCLHRTQNRGYGPACEAGMQHALNQGAQKIIQMDCDFSHPPSVLPQLLKHSEKYDLVLGSRYTPGGATPDWPFSRRLLSRSANLYARTILGLPIRDVTTGFRCFNRRVLEGIDFQLIHSVGYGFLTEMVYRVFSHGFSIGEYPITYRDRTLGQSKMGLHIAWEGVVNVLKIRFSRKNRSDPKKAIAQV
jgi:Glycosyltransferases involved in cell wall biogenesis